MDPRQFGVPQSRKRLFFVHVLRTAPGLAWYSLTAADLLTHLSGIPLEPLCNFLLPAGHPLLVAAVSKMQQRSWSGGSASNKRARVGDPQSSWSRFLTSRERLLLREKGPPGTSTAASSTGTATCAADDDAKEFLMDISQSSNRCRWVDCSPCVTPAGKLWLWKRQRWLLGIEKMMLQGIPLSWLQHCDVGDRVTQFLRKNEKVLQSN